MKSKKEILEKPSVKNVLVSVILLLSVTGNIFAQSVPPDPRAGGFFDKNVFDYHFSRADRETTPEGWLEAARQGAALAGGAWEDLMLMAFDDPEFIASEREKITAWSREELASRFASWLSQKFFSGERAGALSSLNRVLEDARLSALYRRDGEGNLIYDEKTGDPLIVRPGDPDFNFDANKAEYAAAVEDYAQKTLNEYQSALSAYFPELLEYVAPEQREVFNAALEKESVAAENALRRELEEIRLREDRLWTAESSGDIWSLRQKSDSEAAAQISAELIREAEEACVVKYAVLKQRIDAAYAGAGDLALEGKSWLRDYQEQFNAGLRAWQDAEERFFVRRIEWEQNAEKSFSEGEETWMNAFAKLASEREQWEEKSKELFEEGEALFRNLSADLEKSIADAKAELLRETEYRVQSAGERARAWLDSYITAGRMISAAREYIEYYAMANMPGSDREIARWNEISEKYRAVADNARKSLARDFGIVMGNGTLEGVLEENAYSDDFNLDEYQIELLRAEAVMNYWKNKAEISQAVADYAAEFGAGRATHNESADEWRAAKSAYEQALAGYDEGIARLKTAQANLDVSKPAVEAIIAGLRTVETALEALNEKYSDLKSVYAVTGAQDMIAGELSERNKLLAETDAKLSKRFDEAVYYSYLKTARDKAFGTATFSGNSALAELVSGRNDGQSSELSLARLREDYEALVVTDNSAPAEIARKNIIGAMLESRLAAIKLLSAENCADWYFSAWDTVPNDDDLISFNESGLLSVLSYDYGVLSEEYDRTLEYLRSEGVSEEEISLALNGLSCSLIKAEALYEAYYRYGSASNAVMSEKREAALRPLNILWSTLGITPEAGGVIPSPTVIADALMERSPADFTGNAAAVAAQVRELAKSLPQDFLFITESWISGFLNYAAYEAVRNNVIPNVDSADIYAQIELNNEFANAGYGDPEEISRENDELILIAMLLDRINTEKENTKDSPASFARLAFDSAMLNDAVAMLDFANSDAYSALVENSRAYISDNLRKWQSSGTSPPALDDEIANQKQIIQQEWDKKNYLEKEIAKLQRSYDTARGSRDAIKSEMDKILSEIAEKEAESKKITARFIEESEAQALRLDEYQAVYQITRGLHNGLEAARLRYEKADAVKRWASTAYLNMNAPAEELLANNESARRAQIVFEALRDVYDNGETRREYDSAEYRRIYDEYREKFERLTLLLKVKTALANEIRREKINNDQLYAKYAEHLASMAGTKSSPYDTAVQFGKGGLLEFVKHKKDYTEEEIREQEKIKKNRYPLDISFQEYTVGGNYSYDMKTYFTEQTKIGNETRYSTAYERDIRDLSAFIARTVTDFDKYKQWGMARDWLIFNIGLEHEAFRISESLNSGAISGMQAHTDDDIKVKDRTLDADAMRRYQKKAYNELSAEEKRYLEFYTIVTLRGGGGEDHDEFKKASRVFEFEEIRKKVEKERDEADKWADNWKKYGLLVAFICLEYEQDGERLTQTLGLIDPALAYYCENLETGLAGLWQDSSGTAGFYAAYKSSSDRIARLNGVTDNATDWKVIEASLRESRVVPEADIAKLKKAWTQYTDAGGENASDVLGALTKAGEWSRSERDAGYHALETQWQKDEAERSGAQKELREYAERFIEEGEAGDGLAALTDKAYGTACAARKNHISIIESITRENLDETALSGGAYIEDALRLASEYAELITRSLSDRLYSELSVRETEWELQRKSLAEKYSEWKRSVALILEHGRADWERSKNKMQNDYLAWEESYAKQYEESNKDWDAAYYEGLLAKARWIDEAAEVAADASKRALVSQLGGKAARAAAESLDRYNARADSASEAVRRSAESLRDVLSRGGIAQSLEALFASRGTFSAADIRQRTGLSGATSMNTLSVVAAAAILARESNEEIAAAEARKLILDTRGTMEEIRNGLVETVKESNRSFRKNMDDTFIAGGSWRRAGKNYAKDVIVHATLFKPVITEHAVVESYRDFDLLSSGINPAIETDISDERMANLNSFAVNAILEEVNKEIQNKFSITFGDKGKFNIWIGDSPEFKTAEPKKKEIFSGLVSGIKWLFGVEEKEPEEAAPKKETPADAIVHKTPYSGEFGFQGYGEIGRLMQYYLHWAKKEGEGIAAVNTAFYDRPMWDSRGSWFQAPSLKTVADVAVMAVTAPTGGILGAALNLIDDAVFTVMDVATGYKSFGEAGFEFGKKVLTTAVSMGIESGANFGLKMAGKTKIGSSIGGFINSSGIASYAGNTAFKFTKTIATGTAIGAINATTYNNGKLDFDTNGFKNSVASSAITGLVNIGGDLTKTIMDNTLVRGFTGKMFEKALDLNDFTSGAVKEGLNYMMTGEATFNVFNLGFIPGLEKYNTGLLELHLNKDDGFSMNVGTGGMDISLNALSTFFSSLEALKANLKIAGSNQEESSKYKSALRTLYSAGKGSKELELYESILSGTTNVVEDYNRLSTETLLDERTGTKTITLGRNALNTGSEFGLNVILSHEAYRNGIYDGIEGQDLERYNAVTGHIKTAEALMQTYGADAVGSYFSKEAANYREKEENNDYAGIQEMLNEYVNSADFWLVKANSQIVDTRGDPRIWREVIDDNGKVKIELVPGSDETGSKAASLISLLGEDEVIKRLGKTSKNIMSVSVYDDDTLRDVLGWNEERIKSARSNKEIINVDDYQRKMLMGEALLKKNGYYWNDKQNIWSGESMSVSNVSFYGNVGIIRQDGVYRPFTITSMIYRSEDALKVADYENGKLKTNNAYKNNTEVYMYHTDLLTGKVLTYQFEGPLNFVDNTDGSNPNIGGANQAVNHPTLGKIQGATVAAGHMDIRLTDSSKYGEALLFANQTDLKGDKFGANGQRAGVSNDPRTLYHATQNGNSDSCLVSYNDKDKTGAEYFKNNMNYLKDVFKLYRGYSIKTTLIDFNKKAVPMKK